MWYPGLTWVTRKGSASVSERGNCVCPQLETMGSWRSWLSSHELGSQPMLNPEVLLELGSRLESQTTTPTRIGLDRSVAKIISSLDSQLFGKPFAKPSNILRSNEDSA
jgi:hypothetical protein